MKLPRYEYAMQDLKDPRSNFRCLSSNEKWLLGLIPGVWPHHKLVKRLVTDWEDVK